MIMEITLLIMGKSWKNHGILFLNFCGNPDDIPARVSPFSAILRYCIPRGYSVAHSTFVYQPIFLRV